MSFKTVNNAYFLIRKANKFLRDRNKAFAVAPDSNKNMFMVHRYLFIKYNMILRTVGI